MDEDTIILQKPLSQLIADQIKARIWNKEIQFGERLLETELAEKYDVSRSTIREAFKIMEIEELVVSQARKGTYVADFTDQDVAEIIELRTLIEASAFMKAIPRLKKKDFQELDKIMEHMKVGADKKDWNELFDLDMKFHSYVVNLCGNSRIIKIYDSLQVQIRTFLMHLDKYYSSHQSFYDEHKELLEALVSTDTETVKERVKNHIEYVEEKLLGVNQENNKLEPEEV
ncbi:GntR family transcriptional regulator [Virgibacillus profundi]|uniref:GntR family transcriptional regulator n=1 Tax=Virgibacillus profundi TaxID=2024555 RepID=A0A2A2IH37_9BACI|nr:GntR family transcriptional regulator [Virgibacillus profundi]PAV30852.1 GntR family transcriptional regulator [Virgibacillus profundi]PXY55035.1 GntR family transcriptional regulator [Virgibacillus profundi]